MQSIFMTYSGIDNFYLTDEQLRNLPSHRDGLDVQSERALRREGCQLIQEIGILLRHPQVVMAAGQVLFHRFYCKVSFARYDVRRAAKACAWLASKLEECPRKSRRVVLLYHHMDRLHANLPRQLLIRGSAEVSKLEKDLFGAEMDVLRLLGFVCHMELPYKFLVSYLWELRASPELKQVAWNLTNDSFRTTLCVRFQTHVVACGAIHVAARNLKVPLPERWFVAFDVRWDEIKIVCDVLAQMYQDTYETHRNC